MAQMAYSTDTLALAFLLAPEPIERFLSDVWGQHMLHVPGTCEKTAPLFSWDELNRIIGGHRLEPPRMRLAIEGKPHAALPYLRPPRPPGLVQRGLDASRLDLEALYTHLRGGATLILDAIDEVCPPLARLCDGLARCFLTHTQVNAYASFRDTYGLGLHWDDHDVLVVQVAGRKAWRVFRPSGEAPLAHDELSERPPVDGPVWEGELTAGDVLYLPRGWWHAPRGMNEPSLHLTFALPLPTGLDVLDWLVQRVAQAPIARRDLPRFAVEAERHAYADALKTAFDQLWSGGIIDDYLAYRAGRLGLRPQPSLPFTGLEEPLPRDDQFAVRYSGVAATVAPLGAEANTLCFTLAGHECIAHGALRPIMERLLDGEVVSFQQLAVLAPGTVSREELRGLLGELLAAGIIHLLPREQQA
jgi:hypothetical protein